MSTTAAFYAFATVDMMRQAVDEATPPSTRQPPNGSPKTGSKPSTASDSNPELDLPLFSTTLWLYLSTAWESHLRRA